MKENSIKKEQSSIEEDIKDIEIYISFTSERQNFSHDTDWNWNKDLANKIEHVLSDYKRVLKENEYMHNELNKQETTINKYAKENEKLKHKVEGQKCVIEIQGHNEEAYEKLVMKLEKENTELKEENEADYTTVYLKRGL